MSNNNTIKDFGARLMNGAHKIVLTVSRGRLLSKPFGMPVVELHTIGRSSGMPRSCHLTTPVRERDWIVLVASKGGDDRNPDWYKNLQANPDVGLVMNGERFAAHARTASAEERAELWPKVVAAYKGYASHQQRTQREIPLVICQL